MALNARRNAPIDVDSGHAGIAFQCPSETAPTVPSATLMAAPLPGWRRAPRRLRPVHEAIQGCDAPTPGPSTIGGTCRHPLAQPSSTGPAAG